MKVLVDLSVVPLGVGVSLSKYVAACERVLEDAGLTTALHANGTNIEGEWDEVFAAVKQWHNHSRTRCGASRRSWPNANSERTHWTLPRATPGSEGDGARFMTRPQAPALLETWR